MRKTAGVAFAPVRGKAEAIDGDLHILLKWCCFPQELCARRLDIAAGCDMLLHNLRNCLAILAVPSVRQSSEILPGSIPALPGRQADLFCRLRMVPAPAVCVLPLALQLSSCGLPVQLLENSGQSPQSPALPGRRCWGPTEQAVRRRRVATRLVEAATLALGRSLRGMPGRMGSSSLAGAVSCPACRHRRMHGCVGQAGDQADLVLLPPLTPVQTESCPRRN